MDITNTNTNIEFPDPNQELAFNIFSKAIRPAQNSTYDYLDQQDFANQDDASEDDKKKTTVVPVTPIDSDFNIFNNAITTKVDDLSKSETLKVEEVNNEQIVTKTKLQIDPRILIKAQNQKLVLDEQIKQAELKKDDELDLSVSIVKGDPDNDLRIAKRMSPSKTWLPTREDNKRWAEVLQVK